MQIFNNKYVALIILILLSVQISGCSYYIVNQTKSPKTDFTYSEINDELSGETVFIILSDSTEYYGYNFRIENDTAKWIDQKSNIIKTVHIKKVKTIVAKNYFLGALKGLGYGIVGGLILAIILIKPDDAGGGDHGGIKAVGAVLVTLSSMAIGGLVGIIPGAIISHRDYYEFNNEQKGKKTIENEKKVR